MANTRSEPHNAAIVSKDSEAAGTPEHQIKAALVETFNDWAADNHYLLEVGLSGDVADLRSKLNAAVANLAKSPSG